MNANDKPEPWRKAVFDLLVDIKREEERRAAELEATRQMLDVFVRVMVNSRR